MPYYDLDDELLFLQELYDEQHAAAEDPYETDISDLYESDSGGVREPYSEDNDTGWYR